MAKKKEISPLPAMTPSLIPLPGFKLQAVVLFLIGLFIYINTVNNEYALDDGIVISKNEYVQQGFKGIDDILSSDAYESYYTQMGAKQQLAGGRYRPLSIVTFAIEQQVFGKTVKPGTNVLQEGDNPDELNKTLAIERHLANVLLFLVSVVLLLYFLKNFAFRSLPFGADMAFVAALIFTVHPIHTEVIANVKSRDEILSLLFILLTFITALKYAEKGKILVLIAGIISFFLALLSKEYAITLVVLIPLALYLFGNTKGERYVLTSLPFWIVGVLYLLIRFSIIESKNIPNEEILNNPYLLATAAETWATKIYVLSKYLYLLLFPHPLSADYSYNHIQYRNFADAEVWFSLLIHIGMGVTAIKLTIKKHPLAFAFLFYLAMLSLVGNIIMDIGATMGERLIYHSSLGFVMVLAYLIILGIQKATDQQRLRQVLLFGLMIPVLAGCCIKTIQRNAEWKNDITLFTTDVKTVPNSVLANGNAGARYIDLSEKPENKTREPELINKAITHLNKAIQLHPRYVNGYLNLAIAYHKQGNYDQMKLCLDQAKKIYPSHPLLKTLYPMLAFSYLKQGLKLGGEHDYKAAIELMIKAKDIDPSNAETWYNLGGAYFTIGEYDKAREGWTKTLQLNPAHEQAKKGFAALPPKAVQKPL